METSEGMEKMWTRRVTFQHCRVLLWLGPCLEAVPTSDPLHLPPQTFQWGCTATPLEPGGSGPLLIHLTGAISYKSGRETFLFCFRPLKILCVPRCRVSGAWRWAWGKREPPRGFAQRPESPSLIPAPRWEATMSSRVKIFSTRISFGPGLRVETLPLGLNPRRIWAHAEGLRVEY